MVNASESATNAATIHPGQWRLEYMEVANWGTFDRLHRIDIARQGFLLTGHSGSGKSSLVDAIAAVLTPPINTRFNAAAADTASRGSDRTTYSYVRGAWSRRAAEETGEITPQYLRNGATWSGILLRYSSTGRQAPITLVRLFHAKASDTRPQDLSDVMVILNDACSLEDFNSLLENGIDTRSIKTAFPGASVERKHSTFLAKATRRLGISGSNAAVLLHRTQSAKNLGSLDDLFRTYMLDEPDTFNQADSAVEQFIDLQQAHTAVVTARDQIQRLGPLVAATRTYDEAGARAQRTAELDDHLESFALAWRLQLARGELERAQGTLAEAQSRLQHAEAARSDQQILVERAAEQVAAQGGSEVTALEAAVQAAQERVAAATYSHGQLARSLESAGLHMPDTAEDFAELRRMAARELDKQTDAKLQYDDQVLAIVGEKATLEQRRAKLSREIQALTRSGSNLGADQIAARELICRATGIRAADLPFAGQLIEVRHEFSDWTGAIERVFRPIAQVMLVPDEHLAEVRAAANATHLGTRLQFERITLGAGATQLPDDPTSVLARIKLADHPASSWLAERLATRFDFDCVNHERELRDVEQGVTIEGLVKRSERRYDKNDRFSVTDRSHWVLGFSNDDKIELLRAQQDEAEQRIADIARQKNRLDTDRDAAARRLHTLSGIDQVEWDRIDIAASQIRLNSAVKRRDDLLASRGDLRKAKHLLDEAKKELDKLDAAQRNALSSHAGAEAAVNEINDTITELTSKPARDVPDDIDQDLRVEFEQLRIGRRLTQRAVADLSVSVRRVLSTRQQQARDERSTAATLIEKTLFAFRGRWPSLAGDLSTSITDRQGYLEILATLERDDLPRHEERFFDMLRDQSRQNIGVLASTIRNAPSQIRERIDPINESLQRSEFDRGRYLHIDVKLARSAAAQKFLDDLQKLTEGLTSDTHDRSEMERRFDKLNEIMTALRRGGDTADALWRTQVLDTRRHVRFIAKEETADKVTLNVHDSSAGLSGGQKQKLVVFCLAAALRYQLAPDGTDLPTFATIVMDEAFDKADSDFTTMAMDIFVEFGFHMILATPMKLLRTLEPYVGGIALVTCANSKASSIAQITDVHEIVETA